MRHFLKVFNGLPMYDTEGARIVTTRLSDSLHYVSTDEAAVIGTLEKFAKARIGGVSEVTEPELEDLKKKLPASPPPSTPSWIGGPQVALDTTTRSVPQPVAPDVAAVVGSTMAPINEELARLRAEMAALRAKEPPQPAAIDKDIPPPTPPVVGKRTGPAKPHV